MNSVSQPFYRCKFIFQTEFEGKSVAFRRCQMAKGKAGTCEENEVMGSKARICYCNTDSCNSSRNLYASVVTLLSSIASVLMIHVFTQLYYSWLVIVKDFVWDIWSNELIMNKE